MRTDLLDMHMSILSKNSRNNNLNQLLTNAINQSTSNETTTNLEQIETSSSGKYYIRYGSAVGS